MATDLKSGSADQVARADEIARGGAQSQAGATPPPTPGNRPPQFPRGGGSHTLSPIGGPAKIETAANKLAVDGVGGEVLRLSPWRPITQPIDLKLLGKLAEEVCELGSVVSRCIIQGVDECEPATNKPNRQWLQEEIADVIANIELVADHFRLDMIGIWARSDRKKAHLRAWHTMANEAVACDTGEVQS